MKKLALILMIVLPAALFAQDKFITRNGHVDIYSHTVAEDIRANNDKVTATIVPSTGKMVFSIPVRSFEFPKALMQRHFNQKNFMSSKKYPKIKFKGFISNPTDVKWDTDGTYKVNVTGDLTIRDVTKKITETGTLIITGDKIIAHTKFTVKMIGDYGVGKPKSKKKKDNVADDIEVNYKGIYHVKK